MPGMVLVRASTLLKTFLAACPNPGTCLNFVMSPFTALNSPVMSRYFPVAKVFKSSSAPSLTSSLLNPGPAWVVGVGDRIHVGILLQVDLGAEDVVPQSEEEHPIALELRLAAPGHGECPVFGAHLGSVRVGTQAPVGGSGRAGPLIF